jgi:hypothetical protein
MRKFLLMPGCVLALILTACSEPPKTAEKKEPEKLEPATGQSALWKMYQVARTWAPDAQVLKLDSVHLSEVPEVPGKAGAWQATFTSPDKGRARPYTYSIVEAPGNLHKGVFAGMEEGWTGPHGTTQPFNILAVKIDTDAAYRTALGKAADYEKKSPGKPITLLLEKDKKFPNPVWRVIWGESVGTSDFSVFVDASLGMYLEIMH